MIKLSTIICSISVFSLSMNGNAQTSLSMEWNEEYAATTTANFSNEGSRVAVDNSTGNVYVLADVTSDMDSSGVITGLTHNYVAIVKYDMLGNKIGEQLIEVFQHTINGFDKKSGFGLELDGSGNVYVGYNSFDVTSGYDVNIALYDSGLDLIWKYTFNPLNSNKGVAMKVSASGNAYAVVHTLSLSGNLRSAVIKANGMGVSDIPFFTSPGTDIFLSLAIDPSENIYFTGYQQLGVNKSLATASCSNTGALRWVRYDNQGTVGRDDIGKHVIYGSDGFVYITGTTTGTPQQGVNVITIKYNPPNGKKIWENIIHSTLQDNAAKLVQASTGMLYLAWYAGNTVYADMISTALGNGMMRADYSPVPTAPYLTLNGATATDMKISSGDNIYICGNLLATTSLTEPFSSHFVIQVDFTSRGASPVADALFMEGTFAKSSKSVALDLNNPGKKIIVLQDVFENYNNHNEEKVAVMSISVASPFQLFENNYTEATSESLKVKLTHSPGGVVTLFSNQDLQTIEILDVTGKLLMCRNYTITGDKAEMDISSLCTGIYLTRIVSAPGKTTTVKLIKN